MQKELEHEMETLGPFQAVYSVIVPDNPESNEDNET